MKVVGSYEAKTHLAQLLDDVSNGESITITRHGVPVARLVPVGSTEPRTVAETIENIRELRTHVKPLGHDLSLREMIEEGRR